MDERHSDDFTRGQREALRLVVLKIRRRMADLAGQSTLAFAMRGELAELARQIERGELS